MDPVTFLGLVASIIEIATFIRKIGKPVTPESINTEFQQRSLSGRMPEARIAVSEAQVLDTATDYLGFDDQFADRIGKCIEPYNKAIADGSNTDVDEEYHQARVCICENIKLARRHHRGKFPDERFRKWFEQFNCLTM